MALWQLGEQLRAIEALDSKASSVLTAALAFAGLFGASTALAIDTNVRASVVVALLSGVIVLAAFGSALFAFQRAVETTSWLHGPDGRYLLEVASTNPEGRVQLWLVERLVASYEENDARTEEKARWVSRAFVAVIAQGLLTAGGLVAIALSVALG